VAGRLKCSKLDWSKAAISPHAKMLRLYRDLIALRKQNPSLANCRKDLTDIQFDESTKQWVMKRSDPCGNAALLLCNFSSDQQSVPVAAGFQTWRLVLWTGDADYGGSCGSRPPQTVAPAWTADVPLAGFEVAIYVS